MATKKKPQKGRRAPLIQITIQRRPRRRPRLFRGVKALFKAVIKGEPTVRYSGGVGAPAKSPKSKSTGGRGGRPIRNPGWQGQDPYQGGAVWDDQWIDPRDVELEDVEQEELDDGDSDDGVPAWQRWGFPNPEEFAEQCGEWDAEREAAGYDAEAMAAEFGDAT